MGTHVAASLPRNGTRQTILNLLKKSDGLTADQLADQLGITTMAVRKHLATLEREGLVETTPSRRPVGRPARVYRLSRRADELFPKQYDLLVTDLLADLLELDGPGKVEMLLARRAERTRAELEHRLARARSFDERVQILAQGMDELGYLAVWEKLDDSTYLVSQYHCPIREVASAFPAACRLEAQMYRDLLGVEIERSCHLLTGGHCCCYVIRATDTPAGACA